MGIYIKGMKKPDKCEACYCSTHDDRYFDIICDLLHRTVAINDCDYKEPTIPPKDCPLVEVSEPHGRLVDFEEIEVTTYTDADGEHVETSAPTIIESEE